LTERWWMVVLVVLPMVVLTSLQLSDEPLVYESSATYVVRPVGIAEAERLRALDTLSRGVEINSTFANVVGSDRIVDGAFDRLDLSAEERSATSARGTAVTGTYLLEIQSRAPSPELARDVAAAVGEEAVDYISGLENAFGLTALDAPVVPRSPSGSNTTVRLGLATIFGVGLGLGLVYVSGVLVPARERRRFDIVEPSTGAFTTSFLLMRLSEEMSRLRHLGGAVAVATFEVPLRGRLASLLPGLAWPGQLRETAESLRSLLREEDVLAYVGERRFAVLRPDAVDPDWAHQLLDDDDVKVSTRTFIAARAGEPTLLDARAFQREIEAELQRNADDQVVDPVDEPLRSVGP
jgi:capsular polysaccharide biosynthesis protein/GGDEF domain-containing protein